MKPPGWFKVDTPVGQSNPDWAVLKHDGRALYLVRETKGTRDFLCGPRSSSGMRWTTRQQGG